MNIRKYTDNRSKLGKGARAVTDFFGGRGIRESAGDYGAGRKVNKTKLAKSAGALAFNVGSLAAGGAVAGIAKANKVSKASKVSKAVKKSAPGYGKIGRIKIDGQKSIPHYRRGTNPSTISRFSNYQKPPKRRKK